MKAITVRDLRQRWPQAEALLKTEHGFVITRDGEPVAKLIRIIPTKTRRTRFDPAEHATWQARVFGKGKLVRWVDQALAQARADRTLTR